MPPGRPRPLVPPVAAVSACAPGLDPGMDPGMDPAGALPALERELRAALAEDERRQREGEAKLRALRQGVPDYDQFRSGARGLARGAGRSQELVWGLRGLSSELMAEGQQPRDAQNSSKDRAQNSSGGPVWAEICPCSVADLSCWQQWNGTVPSPGHCHLFPFPLPAPVSPRSAEPEGDMSPVPFPACSSSQSCHCFIQGL